LFHLLAEFISLISHHAKMNRMVASQIYALKVPCSEDQGEGGKAVKHWVQLISTILGWRKNSRQTFKIR
jgi:hypothetical protein